MHPFPTSSGPRSGFAPPPLCPSKLTQLSEFAFPMSAAKIAYAATSTRSSSLVAIPQQVGGAEPTRYIPVVANPPSQQTQPHQPFIAKGHLSRPYGTLRNNNSPSHHFSVSSGTARTLRDASKRHGTVLWHCVPRRQRLHGKKEIDCVKRSPIGRHLSDVPSPEGLSGLYPGFSRRPGRRFIRLGRKEA